MRRLRLRNRSNTLFGNVSQDGGKGMNCPLVDVHMVVGVEFDVQAFKIFLDEGWLAIRFYRHGSASRLLCVGVG